MSQNVVLTKYTSKILARARNFSCNLCYNSVIWLYASSRYDPQIETRGYGWIIWIVNICRMGMLCWRADMRLPWEVFTDRDPCQGRVILLWCHPRAVLNALNHAMRIVSKRVQRRLRQILWVIFYLGSLGCAKARDSGYALISHALRHSILGLPQNNFCGFASSTKFSVLISVLGGEAVTQMYSSHVLVDPIFCYLSS